MKKWGVNSLWLVLILIVLSLFFKELIVFFVPGILLLGLKERDFFVKLGLVVGSSLGFWVIAPWFIRFLGIGLEGFAWGVLVVTLVLSVFYRDRGVIGKNDLWIGLGFIVVLLVRLMPYFTHVSGTGDMVMHGGITKVIVDNNGFPESYMPYSDTKFGIYSIGFQTVSAVVSLLSGMEVYRSTLLVACMTYFLITLAVYCLLRKYFSREVAFIAAFFAVGLTTYPQLIFHWGGNPTALSFFFMVMAVGMIDSEKSSMFKLWFLGLMFSASVLTHINPSLGFSYVLLLMLVYSLFKGRFVSHFRSLVVVGILVLVLVGPYLLNFDFGVMENVTGSFEVKAVDHLIMPGLGIELPKFLWVLMIIPVQVFAIMGIPFTVLAFIGFVLILLNKELLNEMYMKYVVFVIGVFLLLLNSQYQVLPFSFSLLTDRVSMLLIVPFSVFFGYLVNRIKKRGCLMIVGLLVVYLLVSGLYLGSLDSLTYEDSPYNTDRYSIGLREAMGLGLYQSFLGGVAAYNGMKPETFITSGDMEAYEWIKMNVDEDSMFLANIWDGGAWITAATGRRLYFGLNPPGSKEKVDERIVELIEDEDITTTSRLKLDAFTPEFLKDEGVDYIYIGERHIYTEERFTKGMFNLPIVYNKNGVVIFKVK